MKYILALAFFTFATVRAQDKLAYRVFDKQGKNSSYQKLLKAATRTEIILFGEYHDNAIDHWLELELAKDLHSKKRLVLGAEMIETDNQKQLDQYLSGEINDKQLDSTARLWPNYQTDYKPLVDFAKEAHIPFIATNIPRRYATKVYKEDFKALEQLPGNEKQWVAPLPIVYDANLPGYVKMLGEMGGHGGANLPKAQAVKDATMAWFILKNRSGDSVFLHFNGSYHSDNFEGIYWYLKLYAPGTKLLTIATVTQEDVGKLQKDNLGIADFIIVVDQDVTKTH